MKINYFSGFDDFREYDDKNERYILFIIEDHGLEYQFSINEDYDVNVFLYGYGIDRMGSFHLDSDDAFVAVEKEKYLKAGETENNAFAFAVYERWLLIPKSVDFKWVFDCNSVEEALEAFAADESKICESFIRNRVIQYHTSKILCGLIKRYIKLLFQQSAEREIKDDDLSAVAFVTYVLSLRDDALKEVVKQEVLDDENIKYDEYADENYYLTSVAELRSVFADLISDLKEYGIELSSDVAAYRLGTLDALLNRLGGYRKFIDNYDLLMDSDYSFHMGDSYPDEEGAKDFESDVYKIAEALKCPKEKIYMSKPYRYRWYDEAHTKIVAVYDRAILPAEVFGEDSKEIKEANRTDPELKQFSPDLDLTENVRVVFDCEVPYSRGKTAIIELKKSFSSRDGFCSTYLSITIKRHYACFDEDEICLVTKDCLNSGLDIEQLFIMETEESDSYEGDVKLFVGKNQDEKYLCDGANSIRCSLFGVLRLCKNSDVINLIQMGE